MPSDAVGGVSGAPPPGGKPAEFEKKGELQGKDVIKTSGNGADAVASKALSQLPKTSESAALEGRVAAEPSLKEKTDKLLELVAKDQREEILPQLKRTVRFIQENKKVLHDKLEGLDPPTYYFRAKKEGVSENGIFNIQISRDASGEVKIFILPKTEELGRGSYKLVRVGLNYTDNKRVAHAKIKDASGIREAHGEFQMQKQFGVADFACRYVLEKGEEPQERMLILMPIANQGDMDVWAEKHSIDELTPGQMKQVAVSFCDFLEKFKKAGIVVSDVKPSNILLHEEGGDYKVLINDVGFAYKKDDSDAYLFGGTHEFVAPEVVQAHIDKMEYRAAEDAYSAQVAALEEFKKGSSMYDKTLREIEKLNTRLDSMDPSSAVKTVGFPRDVYAVGITLAIFYGKGIFPPWISESADVVGGERIMISPERYKENYPKWEKKLAEKESNPDLEYVIFKMTDPNPETRWTIAHAKEALENIDWENDPVIIRGKDLWYE